VVGLDNRSRLVLVDLSGTVTAVPATDAEVGAATVSPDGHYALAAHRQGGEIELVDLRTGAVVPTVRLAVSDGRHLAWAPDSTVAFVSGQSLVALDAATGAVTPVQGVDGAGGPIATLA
jgi:hypothetical protein